MKRRLLLSLLAVITVSSLMLDIAFGYYAYDSLLESWRARMRAHVQELRQRHEHFVHMLQMARQDIEAHTEAVLPEALAEIETELRAGELISSQQLADLAQRHGLDHCYCIDAGGIVYAASEKADIGLNLSEVSSNFAKDLAAHQGSGAVWHRGFGAAVMTGKINVYSYLSPRGSQRTFESSMNIREFVADRYGTDYAVRLFDDYFSSMRQIDSEIVGVDIIQTVFDRPRSLLHEGPPRFAIAMEHFAASDEVWSETEDRMHLHQRASVQIDGEERTVIASIAVSKASLNAFVEALVWRFFLYWLVAAATLFAVTWWLIDRMLVTPIGSLRRNLAAIAEGDYHRSEALPSGSVFADMAHWIEHLRAMVADRQSQLEKDVAHRTQALADAVREAEAQNANKSAFVSMVSHEIRTPLNGIIGNVELLQRTPLQAQQQTFVRNISVSSQSLLGMLNDLLDLDTIANGCFQLNQQMFDLRIMGENVVTLFAPLAWQKGIELIYDYPPEQPSRVIGDRSRLRQVVINFLVNAIKFTEDGSVTLRIRCEETTQLRACCQLMVIDSGVGIPTEQQERLFTRFVQGRAGRDNAIRGSGLGLAISKQIVDAMGGTIHVCSESGIGTTISVRVELPLASVDTSSTIGLPVLALHDCHVLMHAEHSQRGHVIETMLQHWGIPITRSETTEEVLAGLRAGASVLMCDWRAPILTDAELMAYWSETAHRCVVIGLAQIGEDCQASEANAQVPFDEICYAPIRQSNLWEILERSNQHVQQGSTQVRRTMRTLPRSATVLLVDDEPMNQLVGADMLRGFGCTPVVARSGEQAIAMCREQHFDLILLDCQMEGIDGYETARRLRAQEREMACAPTTILAMTANAQADEEERCLAAGMQEVQHKPLTFHQLEQVLRYWLLGEQSEDHSSRSKPSLRRLRQQRFLPELALEALDGKQELFLRLIRVWQDSAVERVQRIREAWERGDAATIRREAHSISGVAGSIGAIALQEVARSVEAQAEDQHRAQLGERIAQLMHMIHELAPLLEGYVHEHA